MRRRSTSGPVDCPACNREKTVRNAYRDRGWVLECSACEERFTHASHERAVAARKETA